MFGNTFNIFVQFADSLSVAIKKTPTRRGSEDSRTPDTSMERRESLVQSIAENLASGIGSFIFRSTPEDTRQETPQVQQVMSSATGILITELFLNALHFLRKQTNKQTDRRTDEQTDRQTDRQNNSQALFEIQSTPSKADTLGTSSDCPP